MQENKNLRPAYVNKADMAISDLTAGGVLVAEQRDRFILVNIAGTNVTDKINVIKMSRPQQQIPRMTTFGARVWRPGVESQSLPVAYRSAPGFGMATLTTHEIMCEVQYPRYVLDSQIEGPAFHDTIIAYLGMHTKRDWEDLIVNGDTTNLTDNFLALRNGMIAGATTNVYPAGAVALDSTVLKATMNTMPTQFKSQPNKMFFTNEIAWSAYDDELLARGTPFGDTMIQDEVVPLPFKGMKVHQVPLFPSTLGIGGNETVVMYLNPKSFTFGIHKDIELQTEYDIHTRVWSVVVTAHVDQVYEYEPCVVKATGVLGA